MKRPAKKFALGTLAVSVIWILFEQLMGYNSTRLDIGQYTNQFPIIFFSIMVVVTIYYKRRGHGNTLTFAEGFKAGLIMSLIYSVGFTIVIILYQKFLNPDMYQLMKDFRTAHTSPEKLPDALKEVEMIYGGTFKSYLMLFLFSFGWGIGISAIATSLLLKKPKAA